MPVQRKRFRIEEFRTDGATMPEMTDGEVMPYHHEIMSELRAIREQMGRPAGASSGARAERIARGERGSDAQLLSRPDRAVR